MNYILHFQIILYLFKVKNYFDLSLVPILPGVCLWNCQGLCLFLSVDFNFLVNLYIPVVNFHVVIGRGILYCQREFYK